MRSVSVGGDQDSSYTVVDVEPFGTSVIGWRIDIVHKLSIKWKAISLAFFGIGAKAGSEDSKIDHLIWTLQCVLVFETM